MSEIAAIEYLYGIGDVAGYDEPYAGRRVVPFQIIKKTAKRIYYVRWRLPNGRVTETGFVDRQKMEASGSEGLWTRRTAAWWQDDARLYLSPPNLEADRVDPTALKAELDRLRREMAAVHPDRGGSDAEFIAAHKRYEAARRSFARLIDGQVAA